MPEGSGPAARCGGRKGALTEPLVLAALQRGVRHGYDIRQAAVDMTGGAASVDVGGLYRILRKLEEDGFVTSEWAQGDSGPQHRDYSITPQGHELAEEWTRHLRERSRLLAAVADLLEEGR